MIKVELCNRKNCAKYVAHTLLFQCYTNKSMEMKLEGFGNTKQEALENLMGIIKLIEKEINEMKDEYEKLKSTPVKFQLDLELESHEKADELQRIIEEFIK